MLTIIEVAKKLKVSRQTVYRLVNDDEIKIIKVRGSTRIEETELDAYKALAEVRVEALRTVRWHCDSRLDAGCERVIDAALADTSPSALLAQGEQARKIVGVLKENGMNLGVVQVPPPILDQERLYALKDAVRAYDRAALAPGEE